MTLLYPDRLRNARFAQQDRKRVVDQSKMWQDHTKLVVPGSDLAEELTDIIYRLGAGELIPEKCYRNRVDTTPDELLEKSGIKHLHLGGSDSDIMLFLVEYVDYVLLLDIRRHSTFKESPKGSSLLALHMNALRGSDEKAEVDRSGRIAAVKSGLLPRRR